MYVRNGVCIHVYLSCSTCLNFELLTIYTLNPPFQMEDHHFAVRLRGLPFDVTEDQVIEFLSGCKIKNGTNGVRFLVGPDSRPLGEAFVVLEEQEDLANSLKHHRETLGRRYVEVVPITKVQMDNELSRQPGEVSSYIIMCIHVYCYIQGEGCIYPTVHS